MPKLQQILIIYAIAIPLALLLGYASSAIGGSDPDVMSVGMVGLVLFVLALPIMMHSYLPILLFCWSSTIIASFLPGSPSFFLILSFASFLLVIVQRGMNSGGRFLSEPSVGWPLCLLVIVVVITAVARGGIGIHALGSSVSNGKKYVELLAAVAGYFVVVSNEIPRKRALLYASLFFVGGVTPAIGDLIYLAGPSFYWMYDIFSAVQASTLAGYESITSVGIFRIEGSAAAAVAFCSFMLVRYGVKGVLDVRRPWRLILLSAAIVVVLYGGYRGRFFLIALFVVFQFFFEGLWRTWLMPVAVVVCGVGAAVVLVYSDRMPEAVQRSISFLPVKVEGAVASDAQGTVEWREAMWMELVPQIPTYLLLGKGYGFTESDMFITTQMAQSFLVPSFEPFVLSGEYHSGPLSVLIPLGLAGALLFLWFLIAGWRLIWKNYTDGDADLRIINTFLLTFYSARALLFFTVFGAFETDLAVFAGAVALSAALNRSARKKSKGKLAAVAA